MNLNVQNILQRCLSRIEDEIKIYKKTFCFGVPIAGFLAIGSMYALWKLYRQGILRENNIKKQLEVLGATDIRYKETSEYVPGYIIIRRVASAKSPSLSLNSKVQPLVNKLVKSHKPTLFEAIGSCLSVFTTIGSATFYGYAYNWYIQYKNFWIVKERIQRHLDRI